MKSPRREKNSWWTYEQRQRKTNSCKDDQSKNQQQVKKSLKRLFKISA